MAATLCEPLVRPDPPRNESPHAATLNVQRFSRFQDVEHLRADWDELAEKCGADLFASFGWCSTWWKHYQTNRQLEIYIARLGGELVGCIPLYRERLSYGICSLLVIRVVGSGDAGPRCHLAVRSDLLDPILNEVARQIGDPGTWDVFQIGDVPSNSCDGSLLARQLGRAFPEARVVFRSGHCPTSTYDLPDSFEEYLHALAPKERSSMRRTHRRLKEDHQAEILATREAELDEVFSGFLNQHEDWWSRRGELGYFRSWPKLTEFHRDFSRVQARHSRLCLLQLKTKDATVGYYYGHRFGKRVHAFSGARSCDSRWDALSPGKQLHCEMVRQAIASGVRHIDSMDGYYQYKQLWGASYHRLQSVTVLSEKFFSRLARRDFLLAARVHHLWNRLWFWHMAPWLRHQFPKLKLPWLRTSLGSLYVRSRFLEYSTDSCAADAICYFGSL